jgi:hypothetical protein
MSSIRYQFQRHLRIRFFDAIANDSTMKFLLAGILSLWTLLSAAQAESSENSENCLGVAKVEDRGYHTGCDLRAFNHYKGSLGKRLVQQKLAATGIQRVPDEETVVCPLGETSLVEEDMMQGQDTMWFVENVASSPVVLTWVKDGVEYSAVNRKIAPPQADPEAILAPGVWKAVHAFEGDIFYARQLLGGVAGPLLLQHRVGLTPIDSKTRNRNSRNPLTPKETARRNNARPAIAQDYDWSTCNVVDIGFRNYAGEPLSGFWLDPTPGHCAEHHKFHLGTNTHPGNFAFDVDSNTKFEKTYIGHTFVFRSVATGELIATYTLAPTKVGDCMGRSAAAKVLVSGEVQDIKIGNRDAQLQGTNATEELEPYLEYATGEELELLKSANASMIPLATAASF